MYKQMIIVVVLIFVLNSCSHADGQRNKDYFYGMGTIVDTNLIDSPKGRRPCTKMVMAVYPEQLKKSKITAVIFIKVVISLDGKVQQAEVIKSENNSFNEKAKQAAMQWEFIARKKLKPKRQEDSAIIRFEFREWIEIE
jgi:TonB family protein